MNIKRLSGQGAAQKMYQDGQGLESNPFAIDDSRHRQFREEMHRLQREELICMIWGDQ